MKRSIIFSSVSQRYQNQVYIHKEISIAQSIENFLNVTTIFSINLLLKILKKMKFILLAFYLQ